MDEKLTKAERKEIRKHERQEWEKSLDKQQKTNGVKKIALWIVAGIATVLSLWGIITLLNAGAPPRTPATVPQITSKDIAMGLKSAKVSLVEYADFQCPACGLYHPILKKLLSEYNSTPGVGTYLTPGVGRVFFVYRFFPLPMHQNGRISAQAAYAAYAQGKFWEMHDMLFEHQNDWAQSSDAQSIFVNYAKQLGLDTGKFQSDMNADSTKKFIQQEEDTGTNAGVNSTPTFFLNGKQILDNPAGYDAFKKLIDGQLKK